MQGIYLKFFVHENERHHGVLLYEWLLEAARGLGISGGTALRAIACYGHHGAIRENKFVELAGSPSIEVNFVLDDDTQADALLALVGSERLRLMYVRLPVSHGVTGADG